MHRAAVGASAASSERIAGPAFFVATAAAAAAKPTSEGSKYLEEQTGHKIIAHTREFAGLGFSFLGGVGFERTLPST